MTRNRESQDILHTNVHKGSYTDFVKLAKRVDNTGSFHRLGKLATQHGVSVRVYDDDRKQWLLVQKKRALNHFPVDVSLVLADPASVHTQYEQTADVIRKADSSWGKKIDPLNIFWNATPAGFQDPEEFLREQEYQAEHNPFEEYTTWQQLGNSSELGEQIFFQYTPTQDFYVSQHELRFGMTNATEPRIVDQIPLVRFGMRHPKKAVVYEVQMPPIFNVGPHEADKQIVDAESRVMEVEAGIKNTLQKYPTEMNAVINKIDSLPTDLGNPELYVACAVNLLINDFGTSNIEAIINALEKYRESLPADTGLAQTLLTAEDACNAFAVLLYSRRMKESFNDRSERMKRLNTIFKTERKDPELKNIPSGPVLSFGSFCALAQAHGVREIDFPTHYPLRLHSDNDFDKRILQQTISTVQSTSNLITGVEIESYPDLDNSFHLRLGDTLSSINPTLQSTITAINGLNQKSS